MSALCLSCQPRLCLMPHKPPLFQLCLSPHHAWALLFPLPAFCPFTSFLFSLVTTHTYLSQFILGLTSSQKCSTTVQSGQEPVICLHTAPWLPSWLYMSLCMGVICFPVFRPSNLGVLLKGSGRHCVASVPGTCLRACCRGSVESWVLTCAEELKQTGKSCLS